MSPPIKIYTDGACKGNPGVGGWGVLIRVGDKEKEMFGGEKETTNNRMELLAVIKALEALNFSVSCKLYSDSAYVINGMNKWIRGWKLNNWTTSANKPVKNADLWKKLDEQNSRHRVEWCWVKGHAGNALNERADILANRGVDLIRGAK